MRIGVIGANSLVGQCFLSLLSLEADCEIVVFSHQETPDQINSNDKQVERRLLREPFTPGLDSISSGEKKINYWVCLAPIWVLPEYFPMLVTYGAERVVALSSTSRFSKVSSPNHAERALAEQLISGEHCFILWSEENGIDWTILRPTLTYGLGRDRNISEIIRFIQNFSFFPVLGSGKGLRQPVHAEDVALSCLAALKKPGKVSRAYNLSGGETLTYREMVSRVFSLLGKSPRFVTLPHWVFRLAMLSLSFLPRFSNWSIAMAERMNQDLVFDNADAHRDLGFSPRPFSLSRDDLPA